MCAKLRSYKLLLLLRLSGAYSIIQMGFYLQINALLVTYKSQYYSINTVLSLIIVNSYTSEFTVHPSCYCILDLLCLKEKQLHGLPKVEITHLFLDFSS